MYKRQHQGLSKQIAEKTACREYIALVLGNIKEEQGTIDAPIGRHKTQRKKMAVVDGGREARTHFRVIYRFGNATLVSCRLETGRTHQIRVHMAYIGHPVLNDPCLLYTSYKGCNDCPGIQMGL